MKTEEFQLWADRGHFTDWKRYPGRINAVRDLAVANCKHIPEGGTWSTTDLVNAMFPEINAHARNYLVSALYFLRQKDMVEGCWRYGPANAKTFGRPSIKWINPEAGKAGLEDML